MPRLTIRPTSPYDPADAGWNHHPTFDKTQLQGWKALHKEKELPTEAWKAQVRDGLEKGLPAADSVEDQAESRADAIDAQADTMPDGAAKEAMENKADRVEEMGEEKANAMDDNGEVAPSETGVGDTQKK